MHCRFVRVLKGDAADVKKRIRLSARGKALFGDPNRRGRFPQRSVVSARSASACAMALRKAQSRIWSAPILPTLKYAASG